MIAVTLKVSGVNRAVRNLTWTPADNLAVALGLLRSGRIMLDSADPNVPVKTGNLRSTGKILGPISISFGRGQQVRVEYGGAPSNEVAGFPQPRALAAQGGRVTYAAEQHQSNPRKPRWLADAFDQEAPHTAQRVAEALRLRLGRKVTGA